MPSSTFNSDSGAVVFHRASKVLIAGLAAICLFFEIGARFGLPRLSRIQARIERERSDFVAHHRDPGSATKTVALIGNSLLLWSIDFDSLNKFGAGRFRYSRFVIESTHYWDWYFGLRRLFEEGARPDAVGVLIGANHWVEDAVEGETFAYELLRPADAGLLRATLDLDRTTAAKYFFASLSAWLGTRAVIRKNLLRLIFPDLELFTRKLASPGVYVDADAAYKKALGRIRDLKLLCDERGVALLVILHPTLDPQAPFDAILRAAKAAGVGVIAPAHLTYSAELFSDGYHLNVLGMEKFTRAVAAPLQEELLGRRSMAAFRPS